MPSVVLWQVSLGCSMMPCLLSQAIHASTCRELPLLAARKAVNVVARFVRHRARRSVCTVNRDSRTLVPRPRARGKVKHSPKIPRFGLLVILFLCTYQSIYLYFRPNKCLLAVRTSALVVYARSCDLQRPKIQDRLFFNAEA